MERLTKLKYYITKLDAKIKNLQERIEKMAFDDKAEVGVKFLASTVSYLKELRGYKQLEEQGLLLRLPCKIGDTIWDNDYGKPCAYAITGFSFGAGEDYIDEPVSLKEVVCYYSNYSGSITGSFAVSEIGKTVFLTKEEAEQKLKEMESD